MHLEKPDEAGREVDNIKKIAPNSQCKLAGDDIFKRPEGH